MRYLLICFCVFTFLTMASGQENDSKDSTTHSVIKKETLDKSQKLDLFFKLMIDKRSVTNDWITRKEVSAWAAVLLYLAIIGTLFKKKEEQEDAPPRKGSLSLMTLILLCLLCLFVHQQFGAINSNIAWQEEAPILAHKALLNDSIPMDIYNEDRSTDFLFSAKYNCAIKKRQKTNRPNCFVARLFLPITYPINWMGREFCPESIKKISNPLEMEESILYNIMILITLMFWYSNLDIEKGETFIEKFISARKNDWKEARNWKKFGYVIVFILIIPFAYLLCYLFGR